MPQMEEGFIKKQLFIVSFCYHGMLGEDIVADEDAITYKTGKLTVPSEYRNLRMKYSDIGYVYRDKAGFLPAVSVHMKSGENYKFVIFFARKKFFELMSGNGVTVNA